MNRFDRIRRVCADAHVRMALLVGLGLSGFIARFWLAWVSEGSNDIRTWLYFGRIINEHGLGKAYVLEGGLNHPPLMSLWAAKVAQVAGDSTLDFARLFKMPSLLAEVITAVLLFFSFRARRDNLRGCAAFALYALALGNALISSFHGNTDSLYFAFGFAAVYLIQARRKGFLAGLMLALALNVKLIPILLVLPLAAACRSRRVLLRYAAGLSLALVPFGLALATFSANERSHFIANVFGYNSFPEWWGIELITRTILASVGRSLPNLTAPISSFHDFYLRVGAKVLIALTGALALWARFGARKPPNAYALSAIAYSILLVLGPGWGVQYMGCLVAPFLAFSLSSGFVVSLATGTMASVVYLHFVSRWEPVVTEHRLLPVDFSGISAVTWAVIALCAVRALRGEPTQGTSTVCGLRRLRSPS